MTSLHRLERLRLSSTPVHDLTPLANLPGLTYLNVGLTKVTTMPAFAALRSLEVLDICGTAITDLSWISECASLVKLNALASYFDSLLPLTAATELQRVTLSVHPGADFSVLRAMKKLVFVGVLIHPDDRVFPAQERALGELASRGVDVVYSDNVDQLVDLLSPVMN